MSKLLLRLAGWPSLDQTFGKRLPSFGSASCGKSRLPELSRIFVDPAKTDVLGTSKLGSNFETGKYIGVTLLTASEGMPPPSSTESQTHRSRIEQFSSLKTAVRNFDRSTPDQKVNSLSLSPLFSDRLLEFFREEALHVLYIFSSQIAKFPNPW